MALLERLVGQDAFLGWVEAAVERPVHAYLIVGPSESEGRYVSKDVAALEDDEAESTRNPTSLLPRGPAVQAALHLAARLIGADERGVRLIASGRHVDVREFTPDGASYKVDEVRYRINFEAVRAPVEGDRKVLVVHEAERMCIVPNAANAFLKTLEEPPPRTVIVLIASAPDDLLPTIASRCARFELAPLSDTAVAEYLTRFSDAGPQVTRRVARLSGGQLGRAERLLTEFAGVRQAFAGSLARLDGTGAAVARVAGDLDRELVAAVESIEQRHERELTDFDARMEREGYESRAARAQRRPIVEHQKRELRRARIDLMMEGIAAMESVIFDVMSATDDPRNDDVARPDWSPRRCAAAVDACRAARAALAVNEKGSLHLEHLLIGLSVQT